MKKVFTGLIAIAVLIVSFPIHSIPVSAAQASFSVSKVTAKPGDGAVVVEMALTGKKIAGFQGELTYNTDGLILKKIEQTSVLSKGLTVFEQNDAGDYLNGSFAYASARGVDMTETVMKFTFQVTTANTDAVYVLKLAGIQVYDQAINDVQASLSDGSITVGKGGKVVNPSSRPSTNSGNNQNPPNNQNQSRGDSPDDTSSSANETESDIDLSVSDPDNPAGTSTELTDPDNLSSDGAQPAEDNFLLLIVGVLAVVAIGCLTAVILINRKRKNRWRG